MDINKKTKIGVLCGGISSEREISIRSGNNCFNALQRLGYSNSELVDIKSVEDIVLLKDKIDIAFLITHGKWGEDGCIQGILEWLKIPYTGSSVTGSAISMDKWITKQIAIGNNIITAKSYLINNLTANTEGLKVIWEDLSKKNGAVFLKPRSDGSSVETYKIKSFTDFIEKVKSINLDKKSFIAEEYIQGREVTTSIIEINNTLKFLPVLELKPKNEFYDYEAKYTKGMTEFILPAKLNQNTLQIIQENALKIFIQIGCSSFGRVDFIIDETDIPYLLEVNSLPGMTDTSDLPAQAKCAGIEYDQIVEIILKTAKLNT